jgi:hypothetical protein
MQVTQSECSRHIRPRRGIHKLGAGTAFAKWRFLGRSLGQVGKDCEHVPFAGAELVPAVALRALKMREDAIVTQLSPFRVPGAAQHAVVRC